MTKAQRESYNKGFNEGYTNGIRKAVHFMLHNPDLLSIDFADDAAALDYLGLTRKEYEYLCEVNIYE